MGSNEQRDGEVKSGNQCIRLLTTVLYSRVPSFSLDIRERIEQLYFNYP
jgi:hypothetical protein